MMRIWLIGADERAIRAIKQLKKNREVKLIVSAPIEEPKAVTEGLIDQVDYVERVNHVNINDLSRRISPDLILIDPAAVAKEYARLDGGMALSDELIRAIASASHSPCIVLG